MKFAVSACVLTAGCMSLAGAPAPTFNRDVAPIVYAHCTGCHHPESIAPMSLLTYKDARPWATAMKEAVLTRKMPPWKADPHFNKFSNDPSLTAEQIEIIKQWAMTGAKEGNPADLPPTPTYSTEWRIGQPDAVFAIPDHELTPSGPDEYEYFTVPTNFKQDMWVQAAELRPGNFKVVHHAHVSFEMPKDPNAVRAPKSEKDAPNAYADWLMQQEGKLKFIRADAPVLNDGCLAEDNGNLPGRKLGEGSGPIASYLPGRGADVYPIGTAKRIPAGAVLKFQVHYSRTTGKVEHDKTSVGLVFAKEPPAQPALRVDMSTFLFKIPAGEPHLEVSECHTFNKDIYITTLTPHMHLRGGDMRFDATYPDGHKETLLSVPHYDFNWQITYRLAKPAFLPKGTKLAIVAHFDNSVNNKYNPDPTIDIRWGEASNREMMDGWVEYLDAPLKAPVSGINTALLLR